MANEQIIEAKVSEFVASNKMFTSVDVSNEIKRTGTWISNSDVASFLKKQIPNILSYQTTRIPVLNGIKNATLYLPVGSDPFDYLDRDQHALTPAEAGLDLSSTNTPSPSFSISSTHIMTATASSISIVGKKYVITAKHRRLRIPAKIVEAVGMVPGDEVDYSKISIIAGCIPTKKIIVHKDGRVFLLKSYVCASNVDKINVYVDQDQIKFD